MFCPYCPEEDRKPIKNAAGLSMHIRHLHPNKWKDGLEVSLPRNYFLGLGTERQEKPIPALARKGRKKIPIPMNCPNPGCDYSTGHPPGMANHIKGNHPELWERAGGSLKVALGQIQKAPIKRGRRMLDLSSLEPKRAEHLRQRRLYEDRRRKRFKAAGLTATGKEYKRGPHQTRSITEILTPTVVKPVAVEVHLPTRAMGDEYPGW